MGREKDKNNKTRQDFLLAFFKDSGYEEKEVNGFKLVKHWNGNKNCWEVAIYSPESYTKYARFNNFLKERSEQKSFLDSI